ncbi:sugar ABC transporter ATP-binding protein [Tetragenococcus koreensis]|uniref:sugar ABC transporter ATP-binding protein n=1 Tax=Tetragenococcus koreensis TaxID=290335 RepID=UPI000F4DBE9D|nr:sugar ABC transporter ATP-binding protein [Tetragenococcus koreensis]MDN6291621.1 sugar ABC transporter ATP-binding protein [Tetragenococcus halophilus]MDN6730734.1 sugar ABC transporter ATP-binding protein [Atopostipes suicloacalis]AYW46525.1 D-xylose ABC transporter ATP-binding protein [Tetragenococcus koreensis]MCF1585349.1 sugar ABC transporter ATP-binding protein [Tetragenococcus koreensis]MCF1619747.1 sugar ABC transporter ATP-binding protein [Tetragenococcus koreensis]
MEIRLENIKKTFGDNVVLSDTNFDLKTGEVHALVGENGAGKSTLMNILTGLHEQNEGKVLVDGVETKFSNPSEAEENGVSFIHQEMITWPDMTVLENMFMGKEIRNTIGWVNNKEMTKQATKVFEELGFSIDLNREMRTLSVGQQQLIEISKTLLNDAKVIIMDEPTAALAGKEINMLFGIIKKLSAEGVSIIYISHRMEEIFEISDRVTVMRDGVTVSTKLTKDTDNDEIVKQMVGRDIENYYPDMNIEKGNVILEIEHLTRKNVFEDVSFQLHEGEILTFSGLMGAGRTEIMRSIFGADSSSSGRIVVNGNEAKIKSPFDAIKAGIGFVTENRKDEGLILDFSIRDNVSLTALNEFSKGGWINRKEEGEFVDLLVKRLSVKMTDINQPALSLSGGNQQKVVLAKWIGVGLNVLILDEPTRGVDVGAKREIYELMKELAQRGVGIIVVSSDLPEVIGISDRVLVVYEGTVTGELNKEELTEENIMTYATGGSK